MSNDHNKLLLSELLEAQELGEPVVLATVIKARGSVPRQSGAKMLVYNDGRISGTIGGGEMEARIVQEALQCLVDGTTRVVPYSLVDPERGARLGGKRLVDVLAGLDGGEELGLDEIVTHAVDNVLVEDSDVSEGDYIKLERLELDAQLIGHVAEVQCREVGLPGDDQHQL